MGKRQPKRSRVRSQLEQLEDRVPPTSMMGVGLGAVLLADRWLADPLPTDVPSGESGIWSDRLEPDRLLHHRIGTPHSAAGLSTAESIFTPHTTAKAGPVPVPRASFANEAVGIPQAAAVSSASSRLSSDSIQRVDAVFGSPSTGGLSARFDPVDMAVAETVARLAQSQGKVAAPVLSESMIAAGAAASLATGSAARTMVSPANTVGTHSAGAPSVSSVAVEKAQSANANGVGTASAESAARYAVRNRQTMALGAAPAAMGIPSLSAVLAEAATAAVAARSELKAAATVDHASKADSRSEGFTGRFTVVLRPRASSEQLASFYGFIHQTAVAGTGGRVNVWQVPADVNPGSPAGLWLRKDPEVVGRLLQRHPMIIHARPIYQPPAAPRETFTLAGPQTDIITPYQRTLPGTAAEFTGELVVQLQPWVSSERLASWLGFQHAFHYPNLPENLNLWQVPDDLSRHGFLGKWIGKVANNPEQLSLFLRRTPWVLDAYPVYEQQATTFGLPNDPLLPAQWHLYNVGQTGATGGKIDGNVQAAWDFGMAGRGVTIGIVDDGLQYTHPDLGATGLSYNQDGGHYVAQASYDFISSTSNNDGTGQDDNPAPGATTGSNADSHGTSVAGVAAAMGNNRIGVSGVAPGALLGGLRVIGGGSDSDTAEALDWDTTKGTGGSQFDASLIDVYNNSWGYVIRGTDGRSVPVLRPLSAEEHAAISDSVVNGRGGLGSIYLFAAGNDRTAGTYTRGDDNTNYQGTTANRYVIPVAAVGDDGQYASYSTPGASLLISAPSSGGKDRITTTDLLETDGNSSTVDGYSHTDYNDSFGGTSSATPFVAGVVALMLEANPNLTWRDVQHILVRSAMPIDNSDSGWQTNGAGRRVSHDYGFGLVNASGAVNLASNWQPVGPELLVDSGTVTVNQTIPDNNSTGISSTISVTSNIRVEHVEVVFDATHTRRGDLEVVLTSPSGVQSRLAESRNTDGVFDTVAADSANSATAFKTHLPATQDGSYVGYRLEFTSGNNAGQIRIVTAYNATTKFVTVDSAFTSTPSAGDEFVIYLPDYDAWTFSSTQHWDETSAGNWTLTVKDLRTGETGTWDSWQLRLYGTESTPDASGPRVASLIDTNGYLNGGSVGSFQIQFDEPVDPASFTTADVSIQRVGDSSITPTSVAAVANTGNRVFQVTFPSQSTVGNYRVDIGPNITDTAGNPMNQDGDWTNGETTEDKYSEFFVLGKRFLYTNSTSGTVAGGSLTRSVSLPAVNLSDLNVLLNVEEELVSYDLRVYLLAPGVTEQRIVEWDNNTAGISNNGYLDTVLDDEATGSIDSNGMEVHFTDSYRPSVALSNFDGARSEGNWSLRLYNWTSARTATFNYYSLILTHTGAIDIALDSVTNTDGDRDQVEVTYTIDGGTAPQFDLVIYESTDPFFNINSDTQTGTFTVTSSMLGGAALNEGTHTIEIPAGSFPDPAFTRNKELYSLVIVDPQHNVADENRFNNQQILQGVTLTDDGTLYIAGDPFEANTVTVTGSTVNFNGTAIGYNGAAVNDIVFTGSTGADSFTASGVDENILAFLGPGNDSYTGGNLVDVVQGGPGTDTISGNDGNDRLYGMQGNDTIDGGAGDDLMSVGPGGTAASPQTLSGGGASTIYSANMDTNPGWTLSGNWAYGTPTGGGSYNGDPSSGYTGSNVIGYNLNGDYPNNMSVEYATTPAIDCSGFSNVTLSFYRWLGVESSSYDHANVQVSNDGTTWTTIWDHSGGSVSDSAWQLETYDISSVADGQSTVYVRWGMGPTDFSVTYPGWNIDDVTVTGMGSASDGGNDRFLIGGTVFNDHVIVWDTDGNPNAIGSTLQARVQNPVNPSGYSPVIVQSTTITGVGSTDLLYVGTGPGDDYIQLQQETPNFGTGVGNSIVGIDALVGAGAGSDHIYGGRGSDRLYGDQYAHATAGAGDGDDTIDSRDGIAGNDTLYGAGGTDTLTGDSGDSIYSD